MTLPNRTHQANSRKRKAEQGLVRVEVWVPPHGIDAIRTIAKSMVIPSDTSKGTLFMGPVYLEAPLSELVQTKEQSDE